MTIFRSRSKASRLRHCGSLTILSKRRRRRSSGRIARLRRQHPQVAASDWSHIPALAPTQSEGCSRGQPLAVRRRCSFGHRHRQCPAFRGAFDENGGRISSVANRGGCLHSPERGHHGTIPGKHTRSSLAGGHSGEAVSHAGISTIEIPGISTIEVSGISTIEVPGISTIEISTSATIVPRQHHNSEAA